MTPEYRENFQKGLEYQDFAVRKLYEAGIPLVGFSSFRYQIEVGENMAGIEIKLDGRMSETRSVYFETAEKSDANKGVHSVGDIQERQYMAVRNRKCTTILAGIAL